MGLFLILLGGTRSTTAGTVNGPRLGEGRAERPASRAQRGPWLPLRGGVFA
jgi:hypothetical protein